MNDKDILPFIPLKIESVVDKSMTVGSFSDGIKIGSMYSGIATALFNSGLSEDGIVQIIIEYIRAENKQ